MHIHKNIYLIRVYVRMCFAFFCCLCVGFRLHGDVYGESVRLRADRTNDKVFVFASGVLGVKTGFGFFLGFFLDPRVCNMIAFFCYL